MNAVGTGFSSDFQNALGVQVGGSDGRGTNQKRFVGFGDVGGIAIGLGVDGDRRQSELLTGAYDPAGDLAAVGDEDFGKHNGRRSSGGSVPDQHFDRSRVVGVARVVELRAVGDQANHIHLSDHFNVATRC